jgi:cysteinyl-tRNA synthetase
MKRTKNLHLYNTETRKKEEIIPLDGKIVRMYTCGPTIYDFAHIGNFRTYVFEDLLRRVLKFFGYQVMQAMNLTDIDDKTLKGSIEKKISLFDFTKPFKEAFFQDLKILCIDPVEFYPEATSYIQEMLQIITVLLEKGYAYVGQDGSIYYSIQKFPKYGRLSHLKLKELKINASERNLADEYDKENLQDFVLWKSYDPSRDGDIYWESPFGRGRPGWHLECSAMATKLLGSSIDIHCGGVDNIFPHHENEIAQSEAFTGKKFVAHWAHSEHLLVEHKKMSKSLGNFYTLRDLLKKGYTGKEVRYLLLQTHYRLQMNFTFSGLDAARASLKRFSDFIQRLREVTEEKDFGKVQPILEKTLVDFTDFLADDLNISPALASLFDLIREINILIDEKKIEKKEAQEVLKFLEKIDLVLQVLPLEKEEAPEEVLNLVQLREEARKEKNWKRSDEIRALILEKGYIIEDSPEGARVKKS